VRIHLILPYPPSELNPNKRLYWAAKTKIKNAEKEIGCALALSYRGQVTADVALSLVFHASTKRSYDLDNALASCKAMIDGLAMGLGINDKQFRPITIDRGEPDKDNPRVEVWIGN
jgi:crossover junction endodeoxyribonuclease RusA